VTPSQKCEQEGKERKKVGEVVVETNKNNTAVSTLLTCLASFAGDCLVSQMAVH
jgi:hypothetical protein